jgi:hypothetical protein
MTREQHSYLLLAEVAGDAKASFKDVEFKVSSTTSVNPRLGPYACRKSETWLNLVPSLGSFLSNTTSNIDPLRSI